jgi:hypothetical protein
VKHVDVFLLQRYGQKWFPGFDIDSMVWDAVQSTIPVKLHDSLKDMITQAGQPSTSQIVVALREKGFSPADIANLLDINHSSISYHLKRNEEGYVKEFINPIIKRMQPLEL